MIDSMNNSGDERLKTTQSAEKLAEIRTQAADRYGDGAEFAYRLAGEPVRYAMLTLEQAMGICGEHIAEEDTDMLRIMLDTFYKNAETIHGKDERVVERARILGREAMQRHQKAT